MACNSSGAPSPSSVHQPQSRHGQRQAVAGAIQHQYGFTLIEMVVVLAVLGLMLGLVVSRGPAHSRRLDLDATARQVTVSLRLARARAIAENRVVRWEAGPGGFRVDDEAPHLLPADVRFAGAGSIGFAADGSSSGGQITLRGGERQVAIGVDWLTGRVRLSERD
jgi:general secretion pathway protein H